jgi:glycosyltransferase involved in cell wall biosynthesis
MGISSARTFRFPYAVDNEYLSSKSKGYRESRGQLLRELGLAPEAFVVLGVLKFVPRENPLELLCGFRLFHEEVPHSALILVGEGALRGELEAYIKASKLAECVRLVGYAKYSELPKWYAMADVFVHPALWECWGVSVNEAMACGLPVIASDRVGSSYDLLREGLNGYRYPSGDAAALAHCLGKIASLPDRGRGLGEASRRLIAGWSYEATIALLRAAVEKVRGGSLAGQASFRAEVHGR